MKRAGGDCYGSPSREPRRLEKKVLRRNAVAMRFWRARNEKRGHLDPGLCDPLPCLPKQPRTSAIHAAEIFVQAPNGLSYRLSKNKHRQHEHGRGPFSQTAAPQPREQPGPTVHDWSHPISRLQFGQAGL
jgi:hypothetical protein